MAADMYPGQGGVVEAKGTDVWTDLIIVGGSVPHDTGGNVQYIYGSGTNQTAKFGVLSFATGSVTTAERVAQLVVVGSIQERSLGVPMMGVGSPVASANYIIQVGHSGTNTGSLQWTMFNEKFGSTTNLRVLATAVETSGEVAVGSISAGSFITYSATASAGFDWIAIGTRA